MVILCRKYDKSQDFEKDNKDFVNIDREKVFFKHSLRLY
jgi:hypothetical protein